MTIQAQLAQAVADNLPTQLTDRLTADNIRAEGDAVNLTVNGMDFTLVVIPK